MIIEQIWTDNPYRNFNYLIACSDSGEAMAIDPLDHEKCLARAKEKGWEITQVLNTHEHGDHIAGNQPTIEATGAKLLAHHQAKDKIPGVDQGLAAGDVVKVGNVELEVLDTPGHTHCHICLLGHGEAPALISGDTVFNAGVGNCGSGDPALLYQTFAEQISRLSDDTRIFPGHDYLANNLAFTLDREPDNAAAQALLADAEAQDMQNPIVTTLGQEKAYNTFLRLESPSLVAKLQERFPELPSEPSPREVFLKLRQLRNDW
ncbi:MAG: hydroxyacylglutathione hydrolase [Alphaproteobacteria bacterium]|nr:hydroxyacylglutathione hydrolase [Rhodospirillaceae bacterium]MDP6404412.1 hydroxyacylglutathione hydrolase [Alphaproteobacteria bacterium]MDP6623754.1 hydroxyacylglutathione hydrolase [Alphaproteobacteria bacterium]